MQKNTKSKIRNPVLFVGAGPGDPELITVKGQHALMEADLVIYAGSLVPKTLLQWVKPEAETLSSASLNLDEIIDIIDNAVSMDKKVVRLHTGDPSLYGAIFEQMTELQKRSIPYRVIPGVTAAFAAAAAMGIEFTLPEISQTLIFTRMAGRTPVPEKENLASLAAHQTSMAIYLSISMIDEVADILAQSYGKNATCAVVFRASQPDEKVITTKIEDLASQVKKENITRQALIIVGKVLEISHKDLVATSKLYDKQFTHGHRRKSYSMRTTKKNKLAVWAITPNGVDLAKTIAEKLSDVDIFITDKLPTKRIQTKTFETLADTLSEQFRRYDRHVFIMATGIVVRMIAPLIQSKVEDPAVVVVDDRGNHAISLLSGHLGGANALAAEVAELIRARPVITTATDVNQIVAIDVLAKEKHLYIENPQAIKTVNMALLKGEPIGLHDPFGLLEDSIDAIPWSDEILAQQSETPEKRRKEDIISRVFIDDVTINLPPEVLVLRPPTLIAGMGCNRNTPMEEMKHLLETVLAKFHLSGISLCGLASINLKDAEPGLIALAETLGLPLHFYAKEELNQVKDIKNPSSMVEKHIGVKSVCEASAILAAQNGTLVAPKQTTRNVTVAIARRAFIS